MIKYRCLFLCFVQYFVGCFNIIVKTTGLKQQNAIC
uniref:Uncharacterized protein n=1 Tax=Anguilla anguilla TaxID=7936 RepID=A0A0E9Q805_ANGAN